MLEAARETVNGLRQDLFGFDVEKARNIDQRKEQIAELFADAGLVTGRRRILELANFLVNLSPHLIDMRPLEAQMRRAP